VSGLAFFGILYSTVVPIGVADATICCNESQQTILYATEPTWVPLVWDYLPRRVFVPLPPCGTLYSPRMPPGLLSDMVIV